MGLSDTGQITKNVCSPVLYWVPVKITLSSQNMFSGKLSMEDSKMTKNV